MHQVGTSSLLNKVKSTKLLWTRELLNKTLCSCKEKICHTWATLEHTPQKTVDINGLILYAETILTAMYNKLGQNYPWPQWQLKQDRQYTYNVTLRHVHATTVAEKKQ